MPAVFSIGYERTSIEEILAALDKTGSTCLVYVRDVPWSRRKEFSRGNLSDVLKAVNIRYLHFKSLGIPPQAREAVKSGDIDTYQQQYNLQLKSPIGKRAITDLVGLASNEAFCLMCYERDPNMCHRLIISSVLMRDHGIEVNHLYLPLLNGQLTLLGT